METASTHYSSGLGQLPRCRGARPGATDGAISAAEAETAAAGSRRVQLTGRLALATPALFSSGHQGAPEAMACPERDGGHVTGGSRAGSWGTAWGFSDGCQE